MLKKYAGILIINLLLFTLLFFTASCAVNPVSGKHELMLISEDSEVKLGRQMHGQVAREYGIHEDSNLTDYVNDFCQRLSRLSHRTNLPYQFKILDTPVINAFALPGGYIYFTRGILAHFNSEAELAGVMGHEIGHITARHSAQQYSRAQLAQIGIGVGMILSDTLTDYGELVQFGVGMLFLSFSRENERQADDLGVEYSIKAGYDATQLAEFFETLERVHPSSDRSGLPTWFSTHPNPVNRRQMVKQRSMEWRQRLNLGSLKINRDEYLNRIDGLIFGEDPRQGYIENNVFYHPLLRFQFPVPRNWKLQNTRTLVHMTSNRKDADILFTISSSPSPQESARRFVNKSKVTVIDADRDMINGLRAHRLISQYKSRQGKARVISFFIQKDDKVYIFHGRSPMSRFNGYLSTFESTMRQFKSLTDHGKLNVKPTRIRIRSTRSSGSLRQALLALGVPEDKLKTIALLNGKHLDDHVPANTLLKMLEGGR